MLSCFKLIYSAQCMPNSIHRNFMGSSYILECIMDVIQKFTAAKFNIINLHIILFRMSSW